MRPRSAALPRRLLALAALTLAATGPLVTSTGQPAVAAAPVPATTLGESTGLRTVAVSTSGQLAAALTAAQPGDRIQLAGGTYTGPFSVTTSGTAAQRIVLEAAPGAAVTLTASLPRRDCAAAGPDEDRTVEFHGGASYWTLRGLTIDGGVLVSGDHADRSNSWLAGLVATHDWVGRRAVPGASSYDPLVVADAVPWVADLTRTALPTSDSVRLVSDVITRKGVFTRLARFGLIRDTVVTDVACGSGPGIWLANFSSGWTIAGNDVSRVAHSDASHYMQEGIRLSSASDYNTVVRNTVHDLPDQGRGITTDVDASFNTISHNTVRDVAIGFNEQQSGWGNTWDHNRVVSARQSGFSFRMEDIGLALPTRDTSTWLAKVSCNVASGTPVGMEAGAMAQSAFTANSFGTISIGRAMRGYWAAVGNTWDGSSSLPPVASPPSSSGSC